jgi:hypothetical protein
LHYAQFGVLVTQREFNRICFPQWETPNGWNVFRVFTGMQKLMTRPMLGATIIIGGDLSSCRLTLFHDFVVLGESTIWIQFVLCLLRFLLKT